MSLLYFWLIVAAAIGAMNLYFGNVLLLVLSVGAFITGICSFFFTSIYFQVTVFAVFSLLIMLFILTLRKHRQNVDSYSEHLRRHVGQTVTVHEWKENRYAKVQYDGKVWDAEIAFSTGKKLNSGKYRIWKMFPNKLILIH